MSNVIRRSMAAFVAVIMAFAIFAMVPQIAKAESTTEEEVTDAPEEEPSEEPEVEPEEEPSEEPTEAPATSAPAVVRTGDATTNMAVAVAATAVVAAAGMGFILKKVR